MNQYSYVENGPFKNLTVLFGGDLVSLTGDHPKFQEIYARVSDPDDSLEGLESLLDPAKAITERFEKVGERVAIKNGHVLFEGTEVNDVITDHIVSFYEEGNDNFKPLVNFLEKLNDNPNEHSKEHLYRWLQVQNLAVTDNGDFIAYKGVNSDLTSIHAGSGIVDGVELKGNLPNNPGSVVEMPRDEVTFDPADGCSFGLHAGTWSYANSFGRRTLEVHINPRDVVSVPTDCGDQKLRTCRYRIVQELDKPYDSSYVPGEYAWDEKPEELQVVPSFELGAEYEVVSGDYEDVDVKLGDVVVVLEDIDDDDEVLVRTEEDYEFYAEAKDLKKLEAEEDPNVLDVPGYGTVDVSSPDAVASYYRATESYLNTDVNDLGNY